MKIKCVQCFEETRKYKCSKCNNYCFDCYKLHKVSDACANVEASSIPEDQLPVETTQKILQPFPTDDTVPAERLAELGNSEVLKELLRNKHLRQFLTEVDAAPNAWKAMRVAMLEPLFVEFADECMKIVEPDN